MRRTLIQIVRTGSRICLAWSAALAFLQPCRAEQGTRFTDADVRQIGSIEYRCADGSYTEPIGIFAPNASADSFIADRPSVQEIEQFIIISGNTIYPPREPQRPFRKAQRACRFRGGLAFAGHRVERRSL